MLGAFVYSWRARDFRGQIAFRDAAPCYGHWQVLFLLSFYPDDLCDLQPSAVTFTRLITSFVLAFGSLELEYEQTHQAEVSSLGLDTDRNIGSVTAPCGNQSLEKRTFVKLSVYDRSG